MGWCNDCGQEHDTSACPGPIFETCPSTTIPSATSDPTGNDGPKFFTEDVWQTDDPELWWCVRLECIKELGYAIMYMNFLHPHRRIDKPFEDSSGWHNQRIAVQTLCGKLANNQDRPDLQWWKDLLQEINNEIENMC